MATSKNQKSSLILILIAFFMEFLAILVLLPNNYLERQIRKEQMIIANRFNDDTIKWLSEFSRDAHKQVIYDSGFYDALHHAFIPTQKEKKKSGKLAGMGASAVPAVVQTVCSAMRVVCCLWFTETADQAIQL